MFHLVYFEPCKKYKNISLIKSLLFFVKCDPLNFYKRDLRIKYASLVPSIVARCVVSSCKKTLFYKGLKFSLHTNSSSIFSKYSGNSCTFLRYFGIVGSIIYLVEPFLLANSFAKINHSSNTARRVLNFNLSKTVYVQPVVTWAYLRQKLYNAGSSPELFSLRHYLKLTNHGMPSIPLSGIRCAVHCIIYACLVSSYRQNWTDKSNFYDTMLATVLLLNREITSYLVTYLS